MTIKINEKLQLGGIHHLTAVTANVHGNLAFYTNTLGMRLVKKTVNQDDTSAYHLFYADGEGTAGTDITFFDWPAPKETRGTNSIARTSLRVSADSMPFWEERIAEFSVTSAKTVERDGRATLDFEDPEGQRLSLVADDRAGKVSPWDRSTIAPEKQIRGLGPITISVPDLAPTARILTDVMNMRQVREYNRPATDGSTKESPVTVFEMGGGGAAAELHVAVEAGMGNTKHGAGGVHHVAFRVPTFDQYDLWAEQLKEKGIGTSGPVDRFYFRSLYFREPNGILFELATDGPGFHADEPMATLGEKLSLPPFLENRRASIEARLKPLY